MKILLVYPEFLVTFWGLKHLLKFVDKKAAFPPLGLLTVAAMLPDSWQKRLIDINVIELADEDIEWADYVFISAMITQERSTKKVISRCNKFKTPVVLGGPILEAGQEKFDGVSHFFWGETEETLPKFLNDLAEDKTGRVYRVEKFPEITTSPAPSWNLINLKNYASMLVQYGRGCPFSCTFCNVAAINGRIPRLKPACRFFGELEEIYQAGFRGAVLVADDNFIGNRLKVKEMLRGLVEWQEKRGHPFEFTVEAPITIVDDPELMDLMVGAGVKKVFLGLETSNEASLVECGKTQNIGRDINNCVKEIQGRGLIPMSGFIVGFDNDSPDTFDRMMINLIQKTGTVIAMVGVLQAPPESKLYVKLQHENRLLGGASGNNTDCYPNFIPKMPVVTLVRGYKRIVEIIYSPREYYERICVFLRAYNALKRPKKKLTIVELKMFLRSIWWIGLFGGWKTSYYYWKTLFTAFFRYRRAFPDVVAFQIYGAHFRKIVEDIKKS